MSDESVDPELSRAEDEILSRFDRGETPDAEEYALRFPQHAERLRCLVRGRGAALGKSPAAGAPLLPGARVGPYEIVRELGRGGMGRVYLARQEALGGRLVALKVIGAEAAASASLRQRFVREARLAGALSHPGIAQVYDAGEHAGLLFYAMRWVRGRPLDGVLRELRRLAGLAAESPDPPDERPTPLHPAPGVRGRRVLENDSFVLAAARLACDVARAVGAAHRRDPPVIHRDLKPPNVLLEEDEAAPDEEHGAAAPGPRLCSRPVVVDFGLARPLDGGGITMSLDRLETPAYVAPEVHQDPRSATPRSDVFCLGVLLHDLLTLADPSSRPRAYLGLPPLREQNPRVDASLAAVIRKATEIEPRLRYRDAADLADDLERYLEREPVRARPQSLPGRCVAWARRRPAAASAALLAVLLLLIAGVTAARVGLRFQRLRNDVERAVALDGAGDFGSAQAVIRPWAESGDWLVDLEGTTGGLWERYCSEPRRSIVALLGPLGASGSRELAIESRSQLLEEISPYVALRESGDGDQACILRLAGLLLERGDGELVRDLSIGLCASLEQGCSGPAVEFVQASPLAAGELEAASGGFAAIERGCLLHLERSAGVPGRSAIAARYEVVRLLGFLPSPRAYEALFSRLDDPDPESVRLALIGLGRIALCWARGVAAAEPRPAAATPRLLEAVQRMLSEDLMVRQPGQCHHGLLQALMAHFVALRVLDPAGFSTFLAGCDLAGRRALFQKYMPGRAVPLVLGAAGAPSQEILGILPTGEASPRELVETATRALLFSHREECLEHVAALVRDPVAALRSFDVRVQLPESGELELVAALRAAVVDKTVTFLCEEAAGISAQLGSAAGGEACRAALAREGQQALERLRGGESSALAMADVRIEELVRGLGAAGAADQTGVRAELPAPDGSPGVWELVRQRRPAARFSREDAIGSRQRSFKAWWGFRDRADMPRSRFKEEEAAGVLLADADVAEDGAGRFYLMKHPARSSVLMFVELPGVPSGARLTLRHVAASIDSETRGGMATISVWINGQDIQRCAIADHGDKESEFPVAPFLRAGVNDIVVRLESGPAECWLRNVRLAGKLAAAPAIAFKRTRNAGRDPAAETR